MKIIILKGNEATAGTSSGAATTVDNLDLLNSIIQQQQQLHC